MPSCKYFITPFFSAYPSFFFSFNAVTWSISAELAFYLVFPFLIALSTRKILAFFFCNILLIFIFAFVLSILQVPSYSNITVDQPVWEGFVYINPIFRLPEFVVGIIAAKLKLSGHFDCCLNQFYYKFHRIRIKSSLLWLFSFALFYWLGFQSFSLDDSIYQPLQASLSQIVSSILFALSILLLTSAPQLIARLLSFSPFVFLGSISFGFYLIHQPIMIRAAQLNGLSLFSINLLHADMFSIFIVSFLLSSSIYYFIEKRLLLKLQR